MVNPRLVIATGNDHKVTEIASILAHSLPQSALDGIVSLAHYQHDEPVEDGVTFEENALIKARSAVQATGLPSLADDSGLSVDVLGGSPGVFSARWCGHHGDDVANRNLVLAQLADVPDRHRGAQFVCAMALVFPDGREKTVRGTVPGHLLRQARGEGGFGYDPIFIPTGHTLTTAEMSAAEKNSLSHRGAALRALADDLQQVLLPSGR